MAWGPASATLGGGTVSRTRPCLPWPERLAGRADGWVASPRWNLGVPRLLPDAEQEAAAWSAGQLGLEASRASALR